MQNAIESALNDANYAEIQRELIQLLNRKSARHRIILHEEKNGEFGEAGGA